MRYFFKAFLVVLLVGCNLQKKGFLEKYMDEQARINGFSGTVLVAKNDSILLRKSYGLANVEWNAPNNIDTKFSLASVSKQFTAVAIMQLAEKNKLALTDPLSKYYPDFPKGDSITIKMLLTHNTGITDDVGELFTSNTTVNTDSIMKFIGSKPLNFHPGTSTAYSNTGYFMLTTIIESVSGQSFETYMRDHIFNTSGMMNSGISSNDSIVLNSAEPYRYVGDKRVKNPKTNWNYSIGLDGVYSNVDDLLLWNKHFFDETTLLSQESKDQMFTSHNDQNFGYGLVINPFYNQGHNFIGHDGGFYGTQTSLHKYPDDDIFIVVLSNNESPSYLLSYGLAAILFGKDVELPYVHKKAAIDPKVFSKYVGFYEGVKIHTMDNKLYYSDYNIELIPESETKFYRSDNDNRTIEFMQNDQGEITHIVMTKVGVKETRKRQP